MAKKFLDLKIAAIVSVLMLAGCARVFAAMPTGFLMNAGCDAIAGWACDFDNFSQPVTIHFYADRPSGTLIGTTVANTNQFVGMCAGSANHGFSFTVPDSLKDGQSHMIFADAVDIPNGMDSMLMGSPGMLYCAAPACTNDCSSSGLTQCNGNGYQTCGNYDSDSCLEWSGINYCPSGYGCSFGVCKSICSPNQTKKCDGDDLYWYDSCGNKGEMALDCGNDILTADYQCSGNWLQQRMVSYDCLGNVCAQNSTWNNVQDCSKAGKICKNSVCVAGDTTPPVISRVAPAGKVYNPVVVLTAVTNEPADCRYDLRDDSFTSMALQLNSSDKIYHSIPLFFKIFGNYTYYVRCRDNSGNVNLSSSLISFNYVAPYVAPPVSPPGETPKLTANNVPPAKSALMPAGVAISSLEPSGTVFQKNVALTLTTDKAAECRWSDKNQDFDAMAGLFTSVDGQNQQAMVDLGDYGQYRYYVRCKDRAGVKVGSSSVIGFEYKNPEQDIVPVADLPETVPQEPLACDNLTAGESDGSCNVAADCVCDPDCAVSGQTDPDCAAANAEPVTARSVANWEIAAGLSGAVFLIIVIAIIVLKKRSSAGIDVSEEDGGF